MPSSTLTLGDSAPSICAHLACESGSLGQKRHQRLLVGAVPCQHGIALSEGGGALPARGRRAKLGRCVSPTRLYDAAWSAIWRSPAAAIELRTEMTGSTNGSAPSKSPLELPQLCGALHSRATSPVQGALPAGGGGQPPEHVSTNHRVESGEQSNSWYNVEAVCGPNGRRSTVRGGLGGSSGGSGARSCGGRSDAPPAAGLQDPEVDALLVERAAVDIPERHPAVRRHPVQLDDPAHEVHVRAHGEGRAVPAWRCPASATIIV